MTDQLEKTHFVQVPHWVLDLAADGLLKPSTLQLYMALLRYADFNLRGNAKPSVATMVECSGLSEATVHRALKELRQHDVVVAREQPGRATVYFLPMDDPNLTPPKSDTPVQSEGGRGTKSEGGRGVTDDTQPIANEREPQTESHSLVGEVVVPAQKTGSNGDGFDQFWAAYPRKVGKGAARKAWAKAIKIAPAAEIIAGLQRCIPDLLQRDDAKFIPHPSTWLNAERWCDEADPVVQPKGAVQSQFDRIFGAQEPTVAQIEGGWYADDEG